MDTPGETEHAPDPRRQRLVLWLAGPVLAGLGLRLWNLRDQILGGDELHLVRAIVRWPVRRILITYGFADSSIPLTALYRWLLDAGVELSESDFRLPALLCGCLALAVLPWAFTRRLDRPTVVLYGWLLAISPSLVLYSRIARSYLPMTLCGCGAVLAFEAWWRTRRWRYAVLYIGLGALAAWLHLGAAPFVAAPFLFAGGDLIVRREGWRRLRDLGVVGIGLALAFAAFLLPARRSLARLVAAKSVDQPLPLATIEGVLRLDAGTLWRTVSVLFWIAALAGLVLLLRHHPRLGAFTLTVVAGQAAGILLLSPMGMRHVVILQRYLLPTLPFVLLWVAYALGRFWSRAQRSVVVLSLLGLFAAGPFLSPGVPSSSFLHHNHFVAFSHPLVSLPEEAVPAIYHRLPPGPVLELPWPTTWELARSFYAYQRIHGHRVLVSAPHDFPRHPQIRFRNEVPPVPEAALESPGRTLIVHLDLPVEELAAQAPGRPPRHAPPRHSRRYRRAARVMADALTRTWGPPDYADPQVQAWDLERVRRTGARNRLEDSSSDTPSGAPPAQRHFTREWIAPQQALRQRGHRLPAHCP